VWEPEPGVTARLRVGSTATTELDRLVDAVTELDRRAWDAWSGSDGARR
jgi:hypothetical protein